MTTPYCVRHIDDMERAFGGGFVRVRAALGIGAFGVQVIDLPPSSGDLYPEHDHRHDGQEEMYVLLDGEAELALPDRTVPLGPGVFARVAPGTRRRVRSGPAGCRLLVVGAVPGAAYVPAPNSMSGGPETLSETASSAMLPGGGHPAEIPPSGAFV